MGQKGRKYWEDENIELQVQVDHLNKENNEHVKKTKNLVNKTKNCTGSKPGQKRKLRLK